MRIRKFKSYKLKTPWSSKTYNVVPVRTTYWDTSLAIELMCVDKDCYGETFATLTVNLNAFLVYNNQAYVDVNNCPWAIDFIKENELGKPCAGITKQSGYVIYPLYEFDLSKIIKEEDFH